jgi:hypothetical protein
MIPSADQAWFAFMMSDAHIASIDAASERAVRLLLPVLPLLLLLTGARRGGLANA